MCEEYQPIEIVIFLGDALSIYEEQQRALTAESALSAAITSETIARIAGDNALSALIYTLVLSGGDNANTTYVDAVSAKLDQEILNRIAGDSALSAQLYSLSSKHYSDFNFLNTKTDTISSNLNTEILNRISGDASLQSQVNALSATDVILSTRINTVSSNLNSEITNRIAGDNALSNRIDTLSSLEASHYQELTNKTTTLSTSLSAETIARINGDNALSVKIDSLSATDAVLSTRINTVSSNLNTEILNRIAGDNALSARIDSLSSLEASHYQALTNKTTTLSTSLSAETIARISGDASLSNRIDTLSTLEGNHFNFLSANIATNSSRIATLSSNLNLEIARSTSVDALLSSQIASLSVLEGQHYQTLTVKTDSLSVALYALSAQEFQHYQITTGRIDSLSAKEQQDYNNLSTRIDTVSTNLNTEISSRIAGDNALSAKIDSLSTNLYSLSSKTLSNFNSLQLKTDSLSANLNSLSAKEDAHFQFLQTKTDTISSNLNAEIANRIAADNAATFNLTANYVPYNGAKFDINLNTKALTAGAIKGATINLTGNATVNSVIENVPTLQKLSERVIFIDSGSSNSQYPTAKATYDLVVNTAIPYVGAIADVELGAHDLHANNIIADNVINANFIGTTTGLESYGAVNFYDALNVSGNIHSYTSISTDGNLTANSVIENVPTLQKLSEKVFIVNSASTHGTYNSAKATWDALSSNNVILNSTLVPFNGATQNVNLNTKALTAGTLYISSSANFGGNVKVGGNLTVASLSETTKTLQTLSERVSSIVLSGNNAHLYPTVQAVVDYHNQHQYNAGTIVLPTITDNGDGSVTIGDNGLFSFASDNLGTGPYVEQNIPGAIYTLADGFVNYILATKDAPSLVATTDNASVNNLTTYPVFLIVKNGSSIAYVDLDHNGLGLADKIELRLARTRRIEIEPGGLILGATNTPTDRTVFITSGTVWYASTDSFLDAFNSSVNTMKLIHHSGTTTWVASALSAYNNTQYDNGTNLVTLTNNRYAVNWVYRSIGKNLDEAYIVLGTGDYTLGEAETSSPPVNVPPILATAVLVGRIIIQRNSNTPSHVESAFATAFTFSGVTDHDALANLQGGQANEYFHLTQAQLASLSSIQLSGTVIRGDQQGRFAVGANPPIPVSQNVNFLGISAGRQTTNTGNSNFLGYRAGFNATNANNSNFLGFNAGNAAANSSNSLFVGRFAGYNALSANDSNFVGRFTGQNTNACNSNFLGYQAGRNATNACCSNFLGFNSGNGATNARYSNFLGSFAGYGASEARLANFLGLCAGNGAINANSSNFLGFNAGNGATNAQFSNFVGRCAGLNALSASCSNFIGFVAGRDATTACQSNFIGVQAGYCATNASYSNFIGRQSGFQATNAKNSNFIGTLAGHSATNACYSIFMGRRSGYCASGANLSIFNGYRAGFCASGAPQSVMIGAEAGCAATNASGAVFLGNAAGRGATNAVDSIAIGNGATPTGPNQFVLGSATHQLGLGAAIPAGTSTSSLSVLINGVMRRIPLF